MVHQFCLFLVLSSFLLELTEMKPETRNKRILYGHPGKAKYRDAYQSFRYYVLLAKGDIVDNPSWWRKLTHGLAPGLEEVKCGGSLLTPSIVQTACHCLARWQTTKNDNYTYAWPLNVWEDRIYSFFGSNEVSTSYDMLIPKHYVIYQHCRKIFFHLHYNMMDIGLIVSKDAVDKKAPKAAISYAPVYRGEEMKEFYYAAIQKEYMCLHSGHGYYAVTNLAESRPEVLGKASELIRWGWRPVMNYVDCLSATYTLSDRLLEPPFNYTRDATCVCFMGIKQSEKLRYLYGPGDSGGPVTCDGVYFAVNSFADNVYTEHVISYSTPIAHTSFENAAEYRDDFIRWSDEFFRYSDLTEDTNPDVPYPHPTYPHLIPTPPPYDIHQASRCHRLFHCHLLINTVYNFSFVILLMAFPLIYHE